MLCCVQGRAIVFLTIKMVHLLNMDSQMCFKIHFIQHQIYSKLVRVTGFSLSLFWYSVTGLKPTMMCLWLSYWTRTRKDCSCFYSKAESFGQTDLPLTAPFKKERENSPKSNWGFWCRLQQKAKSSMCWRLGRNMFPSSHSSFLGLLCYADTNFTLMFIPAIS